MKKIINRTVLARWPGGGMLEDNFFTHIRNSLGLNDQYSSKGEDGIQDKKTIVPQTGFGADSRGSNPGAGVSSEHEDSKERENHSVGSGYNDGGQADDESGPGHSSSDANPYLLNELFLGLDIENGNKDKIQKHLHGLSKKQQLILPHKRHPVN